MPGWANSTPQCPVSTGLPSPQLPAPPRPWSFQHTMGFCVGEGGGLELLFPEQWETGKRFHFPGGRARSREPGKSLALLCSRLILFGHMSEHRSALSKVCIDSPRCTQQEAPTFSLSRPGCFGSTLSRAVPLHKQGAGPNLCCSAHP